MRLALWMCWSVVVMAALACHRNPSIYEARTVVYEPTPTAAKPAPTPRQDPLYEGTPPGLTTAWRNFTKSGRYRMAQSPLATGNVFHYGWSKELLVIVEDQQDKAGSPLKLVYFHPKKDSATEFTTHWVKHNHNLSSASLSNASSKLVVYEGVNHNSSLEYDARRNLYTCLASKQ